jgi:hypothetical protein
MDDEREQHLYDHAWRYFSIHADQRLKAFNFYLLLVTVCFGGLLTLYKDSPSSGFLAPFALVLTILSLIFWKLDVRTKDLIRYGEDALKSWEARLQLPQGNNCPHESAIFSREEHLTAKRKARGGWFWRRHYSYSTCFNAVFLLFGVCGALLCLWLFVSSGQPKGSPAILLKIDNNTISISK